VAVNSEEFGQIRQQNIPKWKLQSEAIRRAVGGQLVQNNNFEGAASGVASQ
jgi:hypothetical protein